MIKKNPNVCVGEQREYLTAENRAHDILVEHGFSPQGCTRDFKKVVIYKIENPHCNNEKKEVYEFKNWQEAVENLIK